MAAQLYAHGWLGRRERDDKVTFLEKTIAIVFALMFHIMVLALWPTDRDGSEEGLWGTHSPTVEAAEDNAELEHLRRQLANRNDEVERLRDQLNAERSQNAPLTPHEDVIEPFISDSAVFLLAMSPALAGLMMYLAQCWRDIGRRRKRLLAECEGMTVLQAANHLHVSMATAHTDAKAVGFEFALTDERYA